MLCKSVDYFYIRGTLAFTGLHEFQIVAKNCSVRELVHWRNDRIQKKWTNRIFWIERPPAQPISAQYCIPYRNQSFVLICSFFANSLSVTTDVTLNFDSLIHIVLNFFYLFRFHSKQRPPKWRRFETSWAATPINMVFNFCRIILNTI